MLSMSANLLLFTESSLFPSLPVKNLENQPPQTYLYTQRLWLFRNFSSWKWAHDRKSSCGFIFSMLKTYASTGIIFSFQRSLTIYQIQVGSRSMQRFWTTSTLAGPKSHYTQRAFPRAWLGMEDVATSVVLEEVIWPSNCQRILWNVWTDNGHVFI